MSANGARSISLPPPHRLQGTAATLVTACIPLLKAHPWVPRTSFTQVSNTKRNFHVLKAAMPRPTFCARHNCWVLPATWIVLLLFRVHLCRENEGGLHLGHESRGHLCLRQKQQLTLPSREQLARWSPCSSMLSWVTESRCCTDHGGRITRQPQVA